MNSQNDRVHLTNRSYEKLSHRLAIWNQQPPQIMVWTAVTADGRFPIIFIEPGPVFWTSDFSKRIRTSLRDSLFYLQKCTFRNEVRIRFERSLVENTAPGVEVNATYYQESVLGVALKP